ncbi:MAG: hypothetical protein KBS67_05520 [Bacteroidales bacterium]|nr:hypothetical protein [Candidatus Cryptobacteroides equifaecalis]
MYQSFNNISDILTSVWNLFLDYPVGMVFLVLCTVALIKLCSAIDRELNGAKKSL